MIPLNLFFFPYAIYRYRPEDFFYTTAMVVLMYITIFEDFMFKNKFIRDIQEEDAME